MKKKVGPVLSHRGFRRNVEVTANPKIIAIRKQAEVLAERIKKEKEW